MLCIYIAIISFFFFLFGSDVYNNVSGWISEESSARELRSFTVTCFKNLQREAGSSNNLVSFINTSPICYNYVVSYVYVPYYYKITSHIISELVILFFSIVTFLFSIFFFKNGQVAPRLWLCHLLVARQISCYYFFF